MYNGSGSAKGLVCVSVCVWGLGGRVRVRDVNYSNMVLYYNLDVCILAYVSVCELYHIPASVCECVCVCVCERESE